LKLQELPVDIRKEVLDYVEFLLKKYKGTAGTTKKSRFDWEGELSGMHGNVTSVELQHKIFYLDQGKIFYYFP
jgi:hypothetical protein